MYISTLAANKREIQRGRGVVPNINLAELLPDALILLVVVGYEVFPRGHRDYKVHGPAAFAGDLLVAEDLFSGIWADAS